MILIIIGDNLTSEDFKSEPFLRTHQTPGNTSNQSLYGDYGQSLALSSTNTPGLEYSIGTPLYSSLRYPISKPQKNQSPTLLPPMSPLFRGEITIKKVFRN